MKKTLALVLCVLMSCLLLADCGAPKDLTEEYLEDGTWKATIKAEDAFKEFELEELGGDADKAKTDIELTLTFNGKNVVATVDQDDITALVKECVDNKEAVDMVVAMFEEADIFEQELGYTVDGNTVEVEGSEYEYEDGKLVDEDGIEFEK